MQFMNLLKSALSGYILQDFGFRSLRSKNPKGYSRNLTQNPKNKPFLIARLSAPLQSHETWTFET